MNTKHLLIVAMMAAMLVGTTALATTESAFATYGKSQSTSQANACGNGVAPLNVGCQNLGSQIQGDENGVSLAGNQAFPPIDLNGDDKK